MYRAIYQNPYDAYRNQACHERKIRQAKPYVDTREPMEQPHLMTKAKKHEMEEDRFAEIERENAILLAKMSKIMREGAQTQDTGGAPPIGYKARKLPGGESLNKSRRKRDLARITAENQAILKRIQLKEPNYNHLEWAQDHKVNRRRMRQMCELPVPGSKQKESRFVRQLRGETGSKGSSTARGRPHRHVPKPPSGSQTDRGSYRSPVGAGGPPESRIHHSLELMRADDMRLLLGMKRPPEIVKKVFAALMIVVSPFETTHSDISWEAVHEWVRQLGGVDSFLENLNHFEAASVKPNIVQNTLDFMVNAELFPSTVKKFSGACATLCAWIWNVCESAQPQLTLSYRQLNKGYQPSKEENVEEEDGLHADGEPDVDFGFAKGEEVGSPRKLGS